MNLRKYYMRSGMLLNKVLRINRSTFGNYAHYRLLKNAGQPSLEDILMAVPLAEKFESATTVAETGIAQNVRVMNGKLGYKLDKRNYYR